MADRPDFFSSPARLIFGPGNSAGKSGTSTWLCVSTPIVPATILFIRRSRSSALQDHGECSIRTAPAPLRVLINLRRDQAGVDFFIVQVNKLSAEKVLSGTKKTGLSARQAMRR